MYLTGIADEASKGIEEQIAATRELGWTHIEARNVDGRNTRGGSPNYCPRPVPAAGWHPWI